MFTRAGSRHEVHANNAASGESEHLSIVLTDERCVIAGASRPGIPTLITASGEVLVDASDWLRWIVVGQDVAETSALEYAKILRQFLCRVFASRRELQDIDDDYLIGWRDHMDRVDGVVRSRINSKLDCVIRFLRWCQLTGRVKYLLGSGDGGAPFKITLVPNERRYGRGRVISWVTPLKLGVRSAVPRHTPTEEEIQEIHSLATRHRTVERDTVILSCAEEAGLRRAEVLRITIEQVPCVSEIDRLIVEEEEASLSIRRKGGGIHQVKMTGLLLRRIRSYIDFEREEVVECARRRDRMYKEPPDVFLSSLGRPLNLNAVSNHFSRMFRDAGVKGASLQRMRARFYTRIVEAFIDKVDEFGQPIGIETILFKAAEMGGVKNTASLRPYLSLARVQRVKRSKAQQVHDLEQKRIGLEREIASSERRLAILDESVQSRMTKVRRGRKR